MTWGRRNPSTRRKTAKSHFRSAYTLSDTLGKWDPTTFLTFWKIGERLQIMYPAFETGANWEESFGEVGSYSMTHTAQESPRISVGPPFAPPMRDLNDGFLFEPREFSSDPNHFRKI